MATTLDTPPTAPAEPADTPRHAHEHPPGGGRIVWARLIPILTFHVIALGVFLVGFSWAALAVCLALYAGRMFIITGFYHRYFSHRTFRTSRAVQALAAFLGTTTAQRGPIWWAAHHRDHHRHSDQPPDIHSPVQHGLEHSHVLWFITDQGMDTNRKAVPDLLRYPELRFIDRFHLLGVAALAAFTLALGWLMQTFTPAWGATPAQIFVWGFGLSTVLLYHGTFTINSLAHTWGTRRFKTGDDSRNNFWLALITLGEGGVRSRDRREGAFGHRGTFPG
ncbi:fatty acid desaturase [Leptolyngbya sp. 15MV]|nr:fatty acid desaturase [Leptolyngbya sp. 15MV]